MNRRLIGTMFWAVLLVQALAPAQGKPRARDLGIPFSGSTGPSNAITDVSGVEVGHATIVNGQGKLVIGQGPVRTGVTAILPRGKKSSTPVFAAWFTLNGNGEMTGTTWVEESGYLGGPIMITNTHSVGVVRDAVIEWNLKRYPSGVYTGDLSLPVVAETWDGFLNDIHGFHVTKDHAFGALNSATGGAVIEGNVGGGTGMIAHGFKGGIGTSSRVLKIGETSYTLGILVQANYGSRERFSILGVPVGKEIADLRPSRGGPAEGSGSIIVIAATDAPLLPTQLKRIAKRVALGVGRMGGAGENSSGDIFMAFSTAVGEAGPSRLITNIPMLANNALNALFHAAVDATEEAVVNAMVAAETMTGINGNTVYALPHDRLQQVMKDYNRSLPLRR
jgi:L-aminopeptidase/D-esterase-like protein